MSDSLYVVMPAYNESASLPAVIRDWLEIVDANPDNRLIVVNDGSTDSTGTILDDLSRRHCNIIHIEKENAGHGQALRTGYHYALSGITGHIPDYVFQTDSDGQTKAAEFMRFWERRHAHDAIIGHRVKRGDGFARTVVTKGLRAIVNASAHVKLEDANSPFRLMKTSALSQALSTIPEKHKLVNTELSIALARLGMKVAFLPISFGRRVAGVNSINLASIARIALSSIAELRELHALLPKATAHSRA